MKAVAIQRPKDYGQKNLFQYFLDGQNILMDWMGNYFYGVFDQFCKTFLRKVIGPRDFNIQRNNLGFLNLILFHYYLAMTNHLMLCVQSLSEMLAVAECNMPASLSLIDSLEMNRPEVNDSFYFSFSVKPHFQSVLLFNHH